MEPSTTDQTSCLLLAKVTKGSRVTLQYPEQKCSQLEWMLFSILMLSVFF